MKNILKSLKLVKSARSKILLLIIIGSISAALSSVQPYIVKEIINSLAAAAGAEQTTKQIIFYLVLFLTFSLIYAVFGSWEVWQTRRINTHLNTLLSLSSFQKLSGLSVDYFEMNRPGSILRKVNDGIGSLSQWIYDLSYNFIGPVGLIIFGLLALWSKFPLIGLMATLALPLNTYIFLRSAKKSQIIYKKYRKLTERSDGKMSETFSNITTTRSLSAERAVYKQYEKDILKARDYEHKDADIWRLSIWLRITITRIVFVASMLIVAYLVIQNNATVGDVVFVNLFLQQVLSQALSIGRFFDMTIKRDVTIGRLLDILDQKPRFSDKPDALPLVELDTIEFKKVSFSYPDGKKGAIKNVSFKIESGKTVALVGPSGTGKSTITKLLLRFYEPTEGQILINGQDVSDFTADSIRQHIGMVMQDVALFNATVEENLGMANNQVNKEAIIRAAKQAHADDFIQNLPQQYRTLVGERGIKLSGGQKQRVAIARAILKDPQLIILDEATSALDSESERLVQEGLKKLMAGRSALVIAHRLSTIMHADEILVLRNGKISERGTHAELMNQTGLYKKLFDLQSSSGKVKL